MNDYDRTVADLRLPLWERELLNGAKEANMDDLRFTVGRLRALGLEVKIEITETVTTTI